MKKNFRLITLVVLIVVSYWVIQRNQYEQFYPVVYSAEYDGLVVDDVNTYENFYSNLEKVLQQDNVNYQKRSGVIFVKKTLYKDLDLCWNYTSKAMDRKWRHTMK